MDLDLTINPATGRPAAFDAAVRLGNVGELFAVALSRGRADGSAPVYLLASTAPDEWTYVKTLSEKGGVVTDWFTDVGPAREYLKAGVPILHLDSDGQPRSADVIDLPREDDS